MEGRTLYACSFVSIISPPLALYLDLSTYMLRYRYFIRLEINSCVSVVTISTCVCIYTFFRLCIDAIILCISLHQTIEEKPRGPAGLEFARPVPIVKYLITAHIHIGVTFF